MLPVSVGVATTDALHRVGLKVLSSKIAFACLWQGSHGGLQVDSHCVQALEFAGLDRITLKHVRGNPLIRKDMASQVDISRCAVSSTWQRVLAHPSE